MLENLLNQQLKQALINHSSQELSYLRFLKSLVLNYKVDHGLDRQATLDDSIIEKIYVTELKKTEDNLSLALKSSQSEAIKQAEFEKYILTSFLPEPLSDQEINQIIDEVIDSNPETTNQGLIIKEVITKIGSRADGAKVVRLIKDKLTL